MEQILIPQNTKYLSEVLSDLPHNVIFDKGLVGCGGTTIAITNNEPYIIAVPFISLVENKASQHSHIFPITGKTSIKSIIQYIKTASIPKIICTYDSLCKLTQVIENEFNTANFRLLVDEYHLLFTSYSFRHEAVRCVLDNYTKFKSYCFMTATVLEDEFILKELQHVPKIEAKWSNVKEVTIASYKCDTDVINTVSHIITKHLNKELKGNAYFFVNSVQFIKDTIIACGLDDSNTKAIWSKNNKIQMPIKLSKTTDSVKPINFFTSTCFEGVDLYDEEAVIYIISDKSKSTTLLDISTAFQQIACRVRNTKYWEKIYHIYSTTRYNVDVSYEQFKQDTIHEIDEANNIIKEFSTLSEKTRSIIKEVEQPYISKRESGFIYDENLVKIDLYNFKITRCLYKLRVNLTKEYQKNNFTVQHGTSLIKRSFKVSKVFKHVVEECEKGDKDYLKWAYSKYDFLETAIIHLGFEKMKELRYSAKLIQRYCIKYAHLTQENKIKFLVNNTFEIGKYYDNVSIKTKLQEIYDSLEVNKTAKASDLKQFKRVSTKQKMIKGETTNGYIMLN
jgi:hypothetical protein